MSRPPDFCTYFDSRYLARGLALHDSLRQHAPGSRLHALCMDDRAFDVLIGQARPGLVPIQLSDFEAGDEDLRAAKASRNLVEYYYTCTPSLPLFVLRRHAELEQVFYIDADFYFFSSVASVLDDWGDGSVYVVGHRYPEALLEYEKYGKYNVGILGFRNDSEGRRCLEQWRRQCIDWCYDRLEDGKFADQKYLDTWPDQFRGLVVSRHPGVNVAPWNKGHYILELRGGVPCVNGRALVCYHFHGLKLYQYGLAEPQFFDYGSKLSRDWIRRVYAPYLRQLAWAEQVIGAAHHGDLRHQRPLALADLTTRGRNAQFLVRTGEQWREVPPALIESLWLARRAVGSVRRFVRGTVCPSAQRSGTT
jgi:hypothetical protein